MASNTKSAESQVDRVSEKAHEAVDKAAHMASSYAERFTEKGDELMQMQEDWVEAAREYVREKPLQALGIAVAAGYLLHMITRR